MPDKMHQEIEEILARLDREAPAKPPAPASASERSPISLVQRRRQKENVARVRPSFNLLAMITPTALLFAGALIMVVGLVVSYYVQPAIWASLGGVFVFIAAFIWSFFRAPSVPKPNQPKGVYWRDRYIEYDSPSNSPVSWLKRKFRR